MLISRVPDEDNGKKEYGDTMNNSLDYHTASELFDIMANNLNLNHEEEDLLTPSELVLIYQNLDLGTNLMANANDFNKPRVPNQYVESIVYRELDSDSELSEINSNEDIHNIMTINDERINLLTPSTSYEDILCQKIRGLQLSTSNVTFDIDRTFIFDDPYLKYQIQQKLNTFKPKELVKPELPVNLLDYICCKRFEEHYNFDMDNIIRYVKLTIDQLKRISNGDYLTERAKEKWREQDNVDTKKGEIVQQQTVLANTTKIPLLIKRKVTGNSTTWDDLVTSPVDVRSISKILEKKIIVEVPKTLCGTYKLFSRCCNDNLIIRCKKNVESEEARENPERSRVDLVLQLNRSNSGHVMSTIKSIIMLQKSECNTSLLPLLPSNNTKTDSEGIKEEKVTELENKKSDECNDEKGSQLIKKDADLANFQSAFSGEIVSGDHDSQPSISECQGFSVISYEDCLREHVAKIDTPFINVHPDELRINMRKINMSSLPEESAEAISLSQKNRKRSPTHNRIKSPYENKSFVIEEKKRRRLLEIRQRREKNKLVLTANGSKVNKHKYPLSPLTSSSVTKLSITNKSFYNSIYGENYEKKADKIRNRKESVPEISMNEDQDNPKLPTVGQEQLGQKCVSNNFYSDNAETQMMYLDIKIQDRCSESSSSVKDYKMDSKIFPISLTPSDIVGNHMHFNLTNEIEHIPGFIEENNELKVRDTEILPNNKHNNTPILLTDTNSSESKLEDKAPKKGSNTAEFRKSIDKIYELINKLGKSESNDTKLCKSKFTAVERPVCIDGAGESSTVQISDSGTSVKHQLTSSNPSVYSFEKASNVERTQSNQVSSASPSIPASKVIISSKSQCAKVENEKFKKDRKNVGSSARQPNVENPLKAISQFLHEIDNAQNNKNRVVTEKGRKSEVTFADIKVDSRSVVRKGSRTGQHRIDQNIEKPPKVVPKEKKRNIPIIMQPPIESKAIKTFKKNVVDIVDEMKEARGEAVRGPCKPNSRLESLAQPRKAYIQAQIEEFQERYGRSIVTDRLQKLSGSSVGQALPQPKVISPRNRRKERTETLPKQSSNSPPAVLEVPKIKKKFNITIPMTIQNKHSPNQSLRSSTSSSLKKRIVEQQRRENNLRVFSANEFISNGKTRVPIVPNEIEMESIISSVDASSTIGSKIHEMLDDLVPSRSARNHIEKNFKDIIPKLGEEAGTTVGCEILQTHKIPVNEKSFTECPIKIKRDVIGDTIPEENDAPREDEVQSFPALNTALSQRLSTGNFPRRLTHKNLILTPNQSMHEVLLLQSGDSNSVVLRSTISQNLQITNSKEDLNCLSELNKFDLSFSPFPLQMPIIEYSFPKYDFQVQGACLKQIQEDNFQRRNDEINSQNNMSIQCYKGVPVDILSEKSDDLDPKDFMFLKSNPSIILEESDEMKSELTEKNEAATEQQIELSLDGSEKSAVEIYCNKKSESCIKVSETILPTAQSSLMEYTNSLDVLVGLLDEIQNITNCQSQIANTDANDTEEQRENMESILKSAAALDHVQREARNIISISSLDKLRKLDSNASILSFYLSGNQNYVDTSFDNINLRPLHADKEVNAVIPLEFDNKCTDVPSRLFPITVNHSTNVSSTLIGVLSQPSSQSLLNCNEYPLQSASSMTTLKRINILKLPKNRKEVDVNNIPVVVYKHKQISEDTKQNLRNKKTTSCDDTKETKFVLFQKSHNVESDFDPVMKMKRDILVTMYSVLVLTVFAALSFPELLYRA
ncbi:hypothetical protein O0L34_g12873 [Tuta absoluta]|nr:hypothetical protein O0L34_g12873 [Tuta absoluta]